MKCLRIGPRRRRGMLCALSAMALLFVAVPARAGVQVQVRIEGLGGAPQRNVRASLAIAQYTDFGANPAATIRRLNAEAPKQIREALQPFGYFSPRISSDLSHEGDNWTATYRIEPGEPVKVRQVSVRVTAAGAKDPAFQAVVENPLLRPGAVLEQRRYTETKLALQRIAADRGYFDAQFTEKALRVDPQNHTADASLVFDTGPRYRFGNVTIAQDILKPEFVRRYVHIHPGEPYDADKLAELQSNLSGSGYFAGVTVTPEKHLVGTDLEVPINVRTTPAKRNHYAFGLGYGTDTGPRFRFSWENRRVNRRGHRFRFDAQISGIGQEERARYIVPIADPATDRLVFSATNGRQDYGDTIGYLLGLGASRITRAGVWQHEDYVRIGRYKSDVGDQTLVSRLLTPGVTFSKLVAAAPGAHRFGYSFTADMHGAARALASDDTFLRTDISAHVVIPAGPGELLLRGELGAVADNDFAHLPVAERFFAGGGASVRGYAYQSLGPRNAYGQVIGGRYLKEGSVEYDWRIVGNWGIAGFFDAGSASNNFTAPVDRGAGIGVRYYTPVGPIRIDFAHPIAHPELGFYRIHISIGLAL